MADQLQFRGGTTSQVSAASVASREIIIDTQTTQIAVGTSKIKTVMEQPDGNVGIGTTSPANKLHVASVVGDGIRVGSSPAGFITRESEGLRITGASTTKNITFVTSGNEACRIDTSGNVGIGTSSPDAKLEIYQGNLKLGSDTNTTQRILFERTGVNRAAIYVDSGNNFRASAIQHVFTNGTDTVEKARLDSAGDFLIGGTLPSSPNITLNASGSGEFIGVRSVSDNSTVFSDSSHGGSWLNLTNPNTTAGTYTGMLFQATGAGGPSTAAINCIDTGSNLADLSFSVRSGGTLSQALRIDSGKNVLIGGTLPSAPNISLNTDGSAQFTGDITCTNNSKGLVLKSPDGTSFRLSVANDGTLSAASI